MQGQRIRKRDKTRCDLDVLIFLYARSAFLAPLSLSRNAGRGTVNTATSAF